MMLKLSRPKTIIGLEATGVYHLLLCVTLRKLSWNVSVINPLESHQMITQGIRTVKTDRIDARKIRGMVLLGKGYVFSDTDAVIALRALVCERSALVQMKAQTKQRITAHNLKARAIGKPLYDSFSPVLRTLSSSIKDLEAQLEDYEKHTQKLLRSIPGVGKISAAALVAYVGNINRFDTPEKLVAYIGLDPRVFSSGTSIRKKGYISKRGNKYLRHILFCASLIAVRYNPELRTYYEKKIGEGKHHFSALCAVERKFIHLVYAVWTRGTPFLKR